MSRVLLKKKKKIVSGVVQSSNCVGLIFLKCTQASHSNILKPHLHKGADSMYHPILLFTTYPFYKFAICQCKLIKIIGGKEQYEYNFLSRRILIFQLSFLSCFDAVMLVGLFIPISILILYTGAAIPIKFNILLAQLINGPIVFCSGLKMKKCHDNSIQ